MTNIKPKKQKKTTTNKVDIKKTIQNKPIVFPTFITDDFIQKHLSVKIGGYTIQEVMEEYRLVNDGFLRAINKLLVVFYKEEVTEDDISYLSSTEYYYHNRKLIRKDIRFFQVDIFKNILEATLSDTIEMAKVFFGDTLDLWDASAYKYRSLSFKISDKYYKNLIWHIDKLYTNLKELYDDFYSEKNEFIEWYSFPDIFEEAQKYEGLNERKQFVNKVIVDCKEFCLKEEFFKVNKNDELEFIQKCQQLIELTDLQMQNGILPTTSESNVVILKSEVEPVNSDHSSIPKTDITLNRQFLALYYLLNEVDKEAFARNKSEIARFIQLLTGKSYDNIYKLTKNPIKDPADRTSKKYQSDIQFVKESFLKLGLNKIAQQIENDNLIG